MKSNDIYSDLLTQIERGTWAVGDQFPTERVLAERYDVSRPTISRVLNRLRDSGHLTRLVGAGTFVATDHPAPSAKSKSLGLFIPGLGKGEIFEPICAHIAQMSARHDATVIWGSIPAESGTNRVEMLVQSAQRLVKNGVDGVFMQPIEREENAEAKNRAVAEVFENASIKIVLLDADYSPYPKRSGHDMVGIDNIASGFSLCQHFMDQGARRIDFLWQEFTAETCSQRLIGYREALFRAGLGPSPEFEHQGDPRDPEFVESLVKAGVTDLICSNDETAALTMQSLDRLGINIPGQFRIAGFDDVKYARLARVPLTTIRQPCEEIAAVALKTMIERIETPDLAARLILIGSTLCARTSTQRKSQE
ncbi:GntR family transcriptional regulator [Martelella endophytica]|uniref:HTH gntR-type domain-containing protein n=1 Tax=Martelella endophytica TaxID=1486262 RepID=A0A0D5LT99_MAREN|nr:substrate-binding domain-containing protein [Martelella endophytica]AJY47321.1 hypothetical protein TM49_19270 [Martelella endophytica]